MTTPSGAPLGAATPGELATMLKSPDPQVHYAAADDGRCPLDALTAAAHRRGHRHLGGACRHEPAGAATGRGDEERNGQEAPLPRVPRQAPLLLLMATARLATNPSPLRRRRSTGWT